MSFIALLYSISHMFILHKMCIYMNICTYIYIYKLSRCLWHLLSQMTTSDETGDEYCIKIKHFLFNERTGDISILHYNLFTYMLPAVPTMPVFLHAFHQYGGPLSSPQLLPDPEPLFTKWKSPLSPGLVTPESARYGIRVCRSIWNLTGASAAGTLAKLIFNFKF